MTEFNKTKLSYRKWHLLSCQESSREDSRKEPISRTERFDECEEIVESVLIDESEFCERDFEVCSNCNFFSSWNKHVYSKNMNGLIC